MTKKHYEAIAAILKARYYNDGSDEDNAIRSVAIALTNYLAQDNPKFNRARFLKACGIKE